MLQHYTIHIHAHNEPAVLPRVLLTFSRRRLRIEAMQFFDLQVNKPAELQIDLDCSPEHARDVLAQLRAIVEVTQVWAEPVLESNAVARPGLQQEAA
ncbi:MAG: acetolactate synthase small subunit [Gammaproteobacteria bacterium]|jgi:acetolactate synthase small subunit